MSAGQKPSIGRIVHAWNVVGGGKKDEGPHAAMIVDVFSDDCVNLAIFMRTGGVASVTSVVKAPTSGWRWDWPVRFE